VPGPETPPGLPPTASRGGAREMFRAKHLDMKKRHTEQLERSLSPPSRATKAERSATSQWGMGMGGPEHAPSGGEWLQGEASRKASTAETPLYAQQTKRPRLPVTEQYPRSSQDAGQRLSDYQEAMHRSQPPWQKMEPPKYPHYKRPETRAGFRGDMWTVMDTFGGQIRMPADVIPSGVTEMREEPHNLLETLPWSVKDTDSRWEEADTARQDVDREDLDRKHALKNFSASRTSTSILSRDKHLSTVDIKSAGISSGEQVSPRGRCSKKLAGLLFSQNKGAGLAGVIPQDFLDVDLSRGDLSRADSHRSFALDERGGGLSESQVLTRLKEKLGHHESPLLHFDDSFPVGALLPGVGGALPDRSTYQCIQA